MMEIGILLLIAGLAMIIAWAMVRKKRITTSVRVGGNVSGVVNTGNAGGSINIGVGTPPPAVAGPPPPVPGAPLWERLLGIAGGLASLVGLYMTLFPIKG